MVRIKFDENISGSNNNQSIFLLFPIFIVIALIPLIVRLKVYNTGLNEYTWFDNSITSADFFLYYKSIAIITSGIIIAILLAYMLLYKKIKIGKLIPFVFLLLYGILAILSSIFALNPKYSLYGISDQFESLLVLLSYIVMTIYTCIVIKTEEDIKLIIKVWIVSIIILCIIGLTQALGHDFYASDLGKKLILPISKWPQRNELSFVFGKNRVYLSLYNPNYVGVYVSLAIPIFLTLAILANKINKKILYAAIVIGLLLCLLGSQSLTAMISLVVIIPVMLIFLRKYVFKKWKIVLAMFIIALAFITIVDFKSSHYFTNKFISIFHTQKQNESLSKIETLVEKVAIYYNDNELNLKYTMDGGWFNISLTDKKGEEIERTFDTGTNCYTLNDKRYPDFQIIPAQVGDIYAVGVKMENREWYFSNQIDNGYYYYNEFGKWDKINNAESIDIFAPSAFSGRGYLWNKTFPLLLNHLLVGVGPDNFTLAFPNNDYVGKENNGYSTTIVTKPHSLYLQISAQTGVLSLVMILIFYLIYIVKSIKLYARSNFETYFEKIGLAILLATISYMISGLTNDSTITVAPIFWILLGIGMAANKKIEQNNSFKIME